MNAKPHLFPFSRAAATSFLALLAGASACAAPTLDDSEVESVASSAQALDLEMDWSGLTSIGGGWDALTGDPRGDCVFLGPLVEGNPGANGNTVQWSLTYTKDSNELRKALAVSASASLKAGFGSGSIKARYAENIATNQYSVFAAARVYVQKPSRKMRFVKLTDANALLVANGKMDMFRRRCGDSFIVGEQSGGEFVGVFELRADSAQKRQDLEVKAKAKSGTWQAQADFASHIEELISSSSVIASGFKIGGSSAPLPNTAEALVQRAYAFEAEVDTNPASYRAILSDYVSLENFEQPSQFSISRQIQVIEDLNSLRLEIKDRLDSAKFVLANNAAFEPFDATKLSARADELRVVLNKVRDAWVSCGEDLTTCAVPALGDTSIALPLWRATPADPKGTPLYGAVSACGIARNNSRAAPPCPEILGAEISATNGEICGYTDVTGTVQDSRCTSHARTCTSWQCPNSHGELTLNSMYANCADLGAGWKPTGVCHERWDILGCIANECKQDASLGTCSDATACGTEFDTCSVVVRRDPKTCVTGRSPSTFAACEDPSFGVAAYKDCWHYADGSLYPGPIPPPAP